MRKVVALSVVVALAALAACGDDETDESTEVTEDTSSIDESTTGTEIPATPSDRDSVWSNGVTELHAGDCYRTIVEGDEQTLFEAKVLPCDSPHEAEVISTNEQCLDDVSLLEEYLGVDSLEAAMTLLSDNGLTAQGHWNIRAGLYCYLVAEDGSDLTQSYRSFATE